MEQDDEEDIFSYDQQNIGFPKSFFFFVIFVIFFPVLLFIISLSIHFAISRLLFTSPIHSSLISFVTHHLSHSDSVAEKHFSSIDSFVHLLIMLLPKKEEQIENRF